MTTLSKASFFSPAKLNLFFRVLKKRGDGFHEIASLMQAISLGDRMHFELSQNDELTASDLTLDCGESNLIMKALQLFREKAGASFSVKIHVEKSIPMEGGLGGGSSNLATTLWALNQFLEEPKPIETLRDWAGLLSSDAPFFFSSGTAYATGRGEKIEDLEPFFPLPLWLAKPNYGLGTPLVYRRCRPHATSIEDPEGLLKRFMRQDFQGSNDLEQSAFRLRPELATLKDALCNLGFDSVLMTGSGTTFYCLGDVNDPKLSDVTFYPATFLSRNQDQWYCA